MSNTLIDPGRRDFLKVTSVSGLGLLIGCTLHTDAKASTQAATAKKSSMKKLEPNAWIRIGTDDAVTVMINHSEMGQGIATGLSMIVAEELCADWSKVRTEFAPVAAVYKNPAFGVQATGGSTSIETSWDILRNAGAAARELLITAAAKTWNVPATQCKAESGSVVHGKSGRQLRYGELVEKAGQLHAPEDASLKAHKDFNVIGQRIPRLDTVAKSHGKAVFGIDVKVPGCLTATVVHPPVFGGTLKSLDPSKAKKIKGVRHVLPIQGGVAVVADTFWQAKKGAEAIKVTWNDGKNADLSDKDLMKQWTKLDQVSGSYVRDDGDVDQALSKAAKVVKGVYELPYQAHACPEPMNCTAHVQKDRCDVWVPTQNQSSCREIAVQITGLSHSAVNVHTTYLGGGFGRRYSVEFVAEAVELSKKLNSPVKAIWTREEDIQHELYRPAFYNEISAGLDGNGMLVAWYHRSVGQAQMNTIIEHIGPAVLPTWLPDTVRNLTAKGLVPMFQWFMSAENTVAGSATIAYDIPNVRIEYIEVDPGIPVGPWRSVSNSRNAFVVESFMDEVAQAGRKDPFELRRALLKDAPKRRKVLELAAEKAGWGKSLPEGRFRGISLHQFHETPASMIAEVSVESNGTVRVHRVVVAVDCGTVINPNMVEAQMRSGIAFGLTATLKSSISIEKGRVQQSNFDDFPILRMDEMPNVEVHIMKSDHPPKGIGEIAVPPIAPAVTNAVFAATGKRIRRIPINPKELQKS